MKKRILSILLCLVMVVSLLPAHVHADDEWEDGFNCEFCGGYVYGDWKCERGGEHCGMYSDRYDCYAEYHCSSCGECFDGSEEYICAGCGAASCCIYEGEYCEECGLCFYCVEEICNNCGRCVNCTATNEICEYCGMCYDDDCGGMCSEGNNHLCLRCHDGYACESCGQCLLNEDGEEEIPFCNQCRRCEECVEQCSAWKNHNLCLECHDDFDYCPDCRYCWLVDIISGAGKPLGCDECGRCIDCVGEICESCGLCFDCVDQCDHCGVKCLDCHEEAGVACPTCGMCSVGVGVRCSDCGNCGECVIRCDNCRACMTCHADNHCLDCGACGREVTLCEGCDRCPECTEYCEECDMCAYCEEDTHCSVCFEHNDSTDLCVSCGACGDCVDLCTDCGECLDCADETNHCSDCGVCSEFEDVCPDCGMCDNCAKSAEKHCSNDLCDNCFENYIYCDTCKRCIECVEEDDEYCYSCYQCKSHHVGGKCNGKSDHTHNISGWVSNASHHWKECRLCKEEQSKAVHVFNSEMVCTVCGYDATEPITITAQPKSVRAKVSDINADLDDPLCPNNNKVSFKVAANITGKALKGTLNYQWYIVSWDGTTANPLTDYDRTEDGHGVVSGAQTSKLTTRVDWVCDEVDKYFCRITLTSSDGKVLATVDSDVAELKLSHVYNQCEPWNTLFDYTLYLKLDDGRIENKTVLKDDGGHKNYCCGEADEEHTNPLQREVIPHNFDTPVTVEASKNQSGPFEEYYQYTCLDCGTVRFVKKHEHNYELVMDFAKPETITFVETYSNNHTHPLRCTVEGCTAVSHEKHSFIPKVYAPPEPHDNGTVTPGRYSLECWQCGYTIGGRELYEANDNTNWDTLRTLVSADYAAVEVDKTYGDFGFGTFCLAMHGDAVNLIPHQKDGKKVIGWTNKYTDYTTKYSGGEHDGEYLTFNNIGFEYRQRDDGTWQIVIDRGRMNSYGANIGGWLHFTPVYATCTHENGTKLANQVDAVCMYSGYTGDEVCVDCGQIIGKVGDFVPAPSDDHTGEWELIEGTYVEANCYQRGYTGDYKCSDCGEIKLGTDLGYKHGTTRIRNTKKGTCVTPAYTGDIYCVECYQVIRAGKTLSLDESNHENTHTELRRAATCVKPGSTGFRICDDCGKTLTTPKPTPALGHAWGDPVVTTEPTLTEPGLKTYHCTRSGCNGVKTETIPSLSENAIASVVLLVTEPAVGGPVSAVETTDLEYDIVLTQWLDVAGNDVALGGTFEGDGIYTIKVELEAVEPNVFTADTIFTINGTPATVTALGLNSVTLICDFELIEAHDFGEWVDEIPATCTDSGVKGHKDCVDCGKHFDASGNEIFDLTIPVNPYAHSLSAWVDEIPATCTDSGVKGYRYCYECGKYFNAMGQEISDLNLPALGHDYTSDWSRNETAHWYDCSRCDSVKSWGEHIYSTDNDRTCNVCAYVREVTLPTPVGPKPAEPVKPVEPVTPVDPTPVDPTPVDPTPVDPTPVEPEKPFTDVPSGAYYEDAVLWAVETGVTGGTSATTFSPDMICTREQAVTLLWRAAGSPAPTSTEMPFTDVIPGSYYYDAVLWAVENGITKGTSDTTFSPEMQCTRAQIVTMLWRSQNMPAVGSENPFVDVKNEAYYANAVLWAVEAKITKGTGNGDTFSPEDECTRAQIVTFIYRCMQ